MFFFITYFFLMVNNNVYFLLSQIMLVDNKYSNGRFFPISVFRHHRPLAAFFVSAKHCYGEVCDNHVGNKFFVHFYNTNLHIAILLKKNGVTLIIGMEAKYGKHSILLTQNKNFQMLLFLILLNTLF